MFESFEITRAAADDETGASETPNVLASPVEARRLGPEATPSPAPPPSGSPSVAPTAGVLRPSSCVVPPASCVVPPDGGHPIIVCVFVRVVDGTPGTDDFGGGGLVVKGKHGGVVLGPGKRVVREDWMQSAQGDDAEEGQCHERFQESIR